MTKRQTIVASLATALMIGAGSLAIAEAHSSQPGPQGPGMMGPGYGMGPGMMGQGYGMGPGMMGPNPGMGPGMMGPGQQGWARA